MQLEFILKYKNALTYNRELISLVVKFVHLMKLRYTIKNRDECMKLLYLHHHTHGLRRQSVMHVMFLSRLQRPP